MRHNLYTVLGITAVLMATSPGANAAGPQNLATIGDLNAKNAGVIKVHSRKRVHDKLHNYGYDPVVFQNRYYDDYDKPVYRFRACMGHRAFRIDVNWYGDIISKRRAGKCYRNHDEQYEY